MWYPKSLGSNLVDFVEHLDLLEFNLLSLPNLQNLKEFPITSFKECWTYSYPWPIELTEPPRTSLVLLKVHCKDMIAPITHVCYSGHTQYEELLKWTDFLRVLCLLCSQLAVHALTQKRSKVHFRSNFLSQWSSVTILHPLPVQGFWPLSSPLAWT